MADKSHPHEFIVQVELQDAGQAPLFAPLSQDSPASTTPLPQVTHEFIVQEVLHVLGQAPLFAPLSQDSPASKFPSPHEIHEPLLVVLASTQVPVKLTRH